MDMKEMKQRLNGSLTWMGVGQSTANAITNSAEVIGNNTIAIATNPVFKNIKDTATYALKQQHMSTPAGHHAAMEAAKPIAEVAGKAWTKVSGVAKEVGVVAAASEAKTLGWSVLKHAGAKAVLPLAVAVSSYSISKNLTQAISDYRHGDTKGMWSNLGQATLKFGATAVAAGVTIGAAGAVIVGAPVIAAAAMPSLMAAGTAFAASTVMSLGADYLEKVDKERRDRNVFAQAKQNAPVQHGTTPAPAGAKP